MDEFEAWAPTYDESVTHARGPFGDVFEGYDAILERTATLAARLAPPGTILDIGAGTGNLTARLAALGLDVIAVDPSPAMRREAARKVPAVPVLEGDFLAIPAAPASVAGIVSSYAFHHLRAPEKKSAFTAIGRALAPGGCAVITDISFLDEYSRGAIYRQLAAGGRDDFVRELRSEPYTTVTALARMAHAAGFDTRFEQLSAWVWVAVFRKMARKGRPEMITSGWLRGPRSAGRRTGRGLCGRSLVAWIQGRPG